MSSSNSEEEIDHLQINYEAGILNLKSTELEARRYALMAKMSELDSKAASIEASICKTIVKYTELSTQYTQLSAQLARLGRSYTDLSGKYDRLSSKLSSDKNARLQKTAKNAKGVKKT